MSALGQDKVHEENNLELLKPDRIFNRDTGEILWDENQQTLNDAIDSRVEIYERFKKGYRSLGRVGLLCAVTSAFIGTNDLLTATSVGLAVTGYGMAYIPDVIDSIDKKIKN